ncbi:hypothetical protein, partial [Helicobacter sp. T3_23-1059]
MSEKQLYTTKAKNIENQEVDSHANQNPKKYDNNGDEIIWEMQLQKLSSNLTFVILSWISRILTIIVVCYFFALGIDKYIHSQAMEWYKEVAILCIAMIFIYLIWVSVYSIFVTLNLKTIYATNKNLIVQKHFGKNIAFLLGSFYIMHDSYISRFNIADELITIQSFNNDIFFSFVTPINACGIAGESAILNLKELENILKPKIEQYLITLNELDYQVFLLDYSRVAFKQIMKIDMAKIQNERE